jgi:hypothetical protein
MFKTKTDIHVTEQVVSVRPAIPPLDLSKLQKQPVSAPMSSPVTPVHVVDHDCPFETRYTRNSEVRVKETRRSGFFSCFGKNR